MTEFVTIKEANESHKGNIRGVIIKTSDLKAGTGKNGDWTMKNFTMQDSTGEIVITCWDTDTGRLTEGQYYEIDTPWYKERKDKPGVFSVELGQYAKVTKIDNPPVQTTMPDQPAVGKSPPETRGEINGEEIPKPSENFKNFIILENQELAQIAMIVSEEMKIHLPKLTEPNGQIIGLRVKEIYRSWKNERKK